MTVHANSLEAYFSLNLSVSERYVLNMLAERGPSCQSELAAFEQNTDSFKEQIENSPAVQEAIRQGLPQDKIDSTRGAASSKFGQNLAGRLSDLEKSGMILSRDCKPDPHTGYLAKIYELNPNPKRIEKQKALTARQLLERINKLRDMMEMYKDEQLPARSIVAMLDKVISV
jgi:hypothetical protein